ncbi:hypothetical protein NIES2135_40140 [Leptolyngbya boryana NIES-2135]|jgi:hypothetical protein|uniref:Uncharacterized protein n=1 Tax=Leptolyngbya boryana NIES-2135 TaxID=1973484 RepID=A0A1Z4JKA1_LEPBY|nr:MULTISPECIES: hypothetical protein [Leptolyngbya]BAY57150.1 hypothetical protein NIES2135_40140 [Leptolyngbya boryana NIES-2135]MBD2367099.1 hypothetical protein [Leptolyngbya sp. FACHB-161]MBD2373548.1 hypothetical protein [Leptolyngbya sp. FACHB-238]MBD2397956.1 hypothetical protein [Leptolyngbya sp. FACHB-239]MBD2404458.1 hypothetical protein [Leptolyngbya sp. FACHB-402]
MNPPSEIPRAPKPESEETPISEAGGMFDAFVSLEEIAPDVTWSDAIADQWGIPNPPNQAAPKVLEQ